MMDIVAREPAQRATYKIYFPLFDDVESLSNEVRLTHQGLRQHPHVQLVDRPELADYLVLCQNHLVAHNPHHARFVAIKDQYKDKTIMLDYGDDPHELWDRHDFRWRLYFKRSVVDRRQGRVLGYAGLPVWPTAYAVVDDMCEPPLPLDREHRHARPLDLSCLFDDSVLESPYFRLARGRLLKFAKRLVATHGLNAQLGTVSECGPVGRSAIDPKYKECLWASKIVLHANPDRWEGDARLWEALAAGALVFVERLHAPIAHPLVDGEHLVFYDFTDAGMAILERQILHYLASDTERERIAVQGRRFVLAHHRSIHRANEIISRLEQPSATKVTASAKPDIIVAMASGCARLGDYRTFVATLRRSGATCPVFLGIDAGSASAPIKKYLLEHAVNYFMVEPMTGGDRFGEYAKWLRDVDFRYALLLDFGATYFQRDPFLDVDGYMAGCDLLVMSELVLGRKAALLRLLDALAALDPSQRVQPDVLSQLARTGHLDHCGRIQIERAGQSLVHQREGRVEPLRDHDGWLLDDDGNVSSVVQCDTRLPDLAPFVSRLSDYEQPDELFVASGSRPYRGQKFTLSSRAGLRPDAVSRLIALAKSISVDKKPLFVLDRRFRRGFVFAYGVLSIDLLAEPEPLRRRFFHPSDDRKKCAQFCEKHGYAVFRVDEHALFASVGATADRVLTADSFAEARALAERWI